MLGLAQSYARSNARANYLLQDAFPATAAELLPEWEEALGLPDSCYRSSFSTVADRQGQVVAKLTSSGGQSVPFFIAYAAKLGYSITIEQFTVARAGKLKAGGRCYGDAWCFAWQVHGPSVTYLRARAGVLRAGEPLAVWGNNLLTCKLPQIAPAHTYLMFDLTE